MKEPSRFKDMNCLKSFKFSVKRGVVSAFAQVIGEAIKRHSFSFRLVVLIPFAQGDQSIAETPLLSGGVFYAVGVMA